MSKKTKELVIMGAGIIENVMADLKKKLGREPTDEEVLDLVKIRTLAMFTKGSDADN